MAIDERFVYLDEAAPGITWDAKYAGSDNLTGAPLDGYNADRPVGTRELGAALELARKYFAALGYGLCVWDAYRPESGVRSFMKWAAQPEDFRTKAAHYPRHEKSELFALGYIAEKSGHSRGGSIDLTLTRDGWPVDMGGTFDLMDDVSHHGYPVSETAQKNRLLLKDGMEKCGFRPYKNEWWHYTLVNEPYPDAYFDFPIE
jgi:D-alanyl-D-alanine dipeptidase